MSRESQQRHQTYDRPSTSPRVQGLGRFQSALPDMCAQQNDRLGRGIAGQLRRLQLSIWHMLGSGFSMFTQVEWSCKIANCDDSPDRQVAAFKSVNLGRFTRWRHVKNQREEPAQIQDHDSESWTAQADAYSSRTPSINDLIPRRCSRTAFHWTVVGWQHVFIH